MHSSRFACVLALALSLLAHVASAQTGDPFSTRFQPTPRDLQARDARGYMPSPIALVPQGWTPAKPASPEPRTLRLRVYATLDYEAQTFGWQDRFRRLLDHVNDLTRVWPGVRFEVVEFKTWKQASAGQTLEALLAALETQDAARDVDWVMGLVSAEPFLPTSIHSFGLARPLGRHLVLRSLNDLMESEELQRRFGELRREQRERIWSEHKLHKEKVLFLHEWAHSLGAIHTGEPDLIMNARYSPDQTHFCEANARIVEIALRHRLGAAEHADWEEAARRELRSFVGATQHPAWDARDREAVLALLAPPPAPAAPPPAVNETATKTATPTAPGNPAPSPAKATRPAKKQQRR